MEKKFTSKLETETKFDEAEKFWASIKPEAEKIFSEYLKNEVEIVRRFLPEKDIQRKTAEEIEEKIKKLIAREENFVKRVFNAINKIKVDDPIFLWDIDNTILITINEPILFKEIGDFIRPSIKYIFEFIKRRFSNSKIGFLTDCRSETIKSQLKDEKYLKTISSFIDSDYLLISVGDMTKAERNMITAKIYGNDPNYNTIMFREYLKSNPHIHIDEDKMRTEPESADYKLFTNFLDNMILQNLYNFLAKNPQVNKKKVLPALQGRACDINQGGLYKLRLLERFREDQTVIVIDDFSYPKYLKNGVALESDESFILF